MLTKATLRYIRSLEHRKWRRTAMAFVAEGAKTVGELAGRMECEHLVITDEWAGANARTLSRILDRADACEVTYVRESDFGRVSFLQAPQGVLAVFRIPQYEAEDPAAALTSRLNIALDGVQDPGNLGTIVRLADWFGIEDIWCSATTADVWNPKAVQATMGSLARVRVHYINLRETLSTLPQQTPRYATMLDGEPLWTTPLAATGVIVFGNEGNGITPDVAACCDRRLLIQPFPPGHATTDSLNVGVAAAIVLAEFRRQASFHQNPPS